MLPLPKAKASYSKAKVSYDWVFERNEARTVGPLLNLLRELRPSMEDLFVAQKVPPRVAEPLLRETLQSLAWKWEAVRNRQDWLLAILGRKCATAKEAADQQPWDGLG